MMANVLESLVIQLGLDAKGVSSGAQKAEADIDKIVSSAEKATDALDNGLSDAAENASSSLKKTGDEANNAASAIDEKLSPAASSASRTIDDATKKIDRSSDAMSDAGKSAQNLGKSIKSEAEDASDALDDLSVSLEETSETSKVTGTSLNGAGKGASSLRDRLEKNLSPASRKANEQLRALGKTGDDVGKKLSGGFEKARNQALALMAVFTAGRSIGAFIEHTTEANAQLGYAAQRLNTNPQQLWAANHAVMAMGGSEQEVTSALGSIQQMQTTPEGAARLANVMGQLGVRNYQEDIRNGPDALMKDINRVTQGMDQGRKNNLLGQLGFGPGMINTVDQTTAAFDKLIASKKGLAPTNSEISNSQKLMSDFRQFADVNDHFARVLENDVAPAIDNVIVKITKWEQQNGEWVKGILIATTAVAGLGSALAGIAAAKGAFNLVRGILKPGSVVAKAASVPGCCTCCNSGPSDEGLPANGKESRESGKAKDGAAGKSGRDGVEGKVGREGAAGVAGKAGREGAKVTEAVEAATAPVENAVKEAEPRASRGLVGEAGTYLAKGSDASGFVFRRWALRAGLRAIPFVGAAADLYGGQLNKGESDTLNRLQSRGDDANYQSALATSVARIESGGKYDIVGGAGHNYYGKYQLSRNVIADAAKKLNEATPTTQQFLSDPKMQDRYFTAFTEQNKAYLEAHSAIFRKMSKAQQYAVLGYAHNQGAGGALKWLNGGEVGHDAFGTSGTRYSDEFLAQLSRTKTDTQESSPQYNKAVQVVKMASAAESPQNSDRAPIKSADASVPKYSDAIKTVIHQPSQNTTNSTHNSTTVGDLHITVNTPNGSNGTQIARDIHTELKRSLPIQNIYGQA